MQQVAEVALQRKELEVQEKALKDALLAEMKKLGKDKEKTEYGSFLVKPYTKWYYSEATTAMAQALKIKQIEEQEKGIAAAEVTESLTFTPTKTK